MFDIYDIKNSRRGKNRAALPTYEELFIERPDERTLPYFSAVPEQFLSETPYLQLTPHEQGQFLRLVIHVMWRDCARCIRHPGVIASRLGMREEEWVELEKVLIKHELLVLSPDDHYLVQPDLRAQYLMTLETNNNKRKNSP